MTSRNITEPTIHWYKIDNAGMIFPSVFSERTSMLFRLSCLLKDRVRISILQTALDNIIPRFPYYQVHLRRGFFWYYFETNPARPLISADSAYPCGILRVKKRCTFLFRVRAFRNMVSVEFFHALSDASGAGIFLRTLLCEYFTLQGIICPDWGELEAFRPGSGICKEEEEDAFCRYHNKKIPAASWLTQKAFHIPYKMDKKGVYHIITGVIPVQTLLNASKANKVTVTEFLIAHLFYALQEIWFRTNSHKNGKLKKPIRVLIPVNLRKIFPSATMRNFSLYVSPEITPFLGRYTYEEILQHVHHSMRINVAKKPLQQQISLNFTTAYHFLFRRLPLFIKNFVFSMVFNIFANGAYTTSFSNLGILDLPEAYAQQVEQFELYPQPNISGGVNIAAVTYKDRMTITFGRSAKNAELEKIFFQNLVKMKIPVKIETNQE